MGIFEAFDMGSLGDKLLLFRLHWFCGLGS